MPKDWITKYHSKHYENQPQQANGDDFDLFYDLSSFDQDVDVDSAWHVVQSKIQKRSSFHVFWRVAAILVVLFGLGYVAYDYQQLSTPQEVVVQSETRVKTYSLPDGSVVTLAPQSKLTFDSDFRKDRIVQFTGEAYFDVTKDNSTFTIRTEKGTINVLGTSFNLKATKEIEVYVSSGKVMVSSEGLSKEVQPGQLAVTRNGEIAIEAYDGVNLLSWRTGHFVFENKPLKEVIPHLEKYYQVDFTIEESLKNCKITVEFKESELADVVRVISTILSAKSQINGNQINISGPGCN